MLFKKKHFFGFLIAIAFCMILSSCKGQDAYYQSAGEIFKTGFHIKYKYARTLDDEIQAELKKFDLSLNPFNSESIIYQVNNNIPVEVDPWFINVFNKAREVSEISGGDYDITCTPFINLWGFGFSKIDNVNQATIDSLKEFVGYKKVRIEGQTVIKDDPRIQFNASSIAKGYSCDVIAALFDSLGITDYMIEIGGEINAKGKNQRGECWRIEISKPIDDTAGLQQERMEVVKLCDKSLATSGNYRKFYVKDGKKYSHTINPHTGYPAESNILSASVFHKDCMTADAFATAFMTMYLEKAVSIGNQIPDLDYLFIYADESGVLQEKKSSNMDQYIIK
jgi:thiamine biosynthesis lipoprotein